MRSGAKAIVTATLFFISCEAAGQAHDSSAVVSSNENDHALTPLEKQNRHFYDVLLPGRRGLQPTVLYSGDDRFFIGFAYNDFSADWKADSTGSRQLAYLRYSINQKAFSIGYRGIINRIAPDWNLYADAAYDWVKWTNFYGLGNETVQQTTNADYYRIRSRDAYLGLRFQRRLGRQSNFAVTPFYQCIQLLTNEGHFLASDYIKGKSTAVYSAKNFGGLGADLLLQKLDDLLLPTKGLSVSLGATYTRNLNDASAFASYDAAVKWYVPFLSRFVFVTENGAATVTGQPQFYQLASLGGGTLRGYRSERFWGQTAFHSNNEVQYLFNAPAKLFKGKMGLTAFADGGRVWLRGEQSKVWHYGFGGGVLVAVYNKIYLAAQLGVSPERTGFHFTVRRSL